MRHLVLKPSKAIFIRQYRVPGVLFYAEAGTNQFVDALFTLYSVPCRVSDSKGKQRVCCSHRLGEGSGWEAEHPPGAGAVAHISAAHITGNLLCSARSIRNKVLPTVFRC